MYSGSCIEHCQSNSNILFCSNPLKTNNQTGILMDYRHTHAEEREEWNPKHTTTLHSALQHGALNVELLQVVGPRLWRKNTLSLKDNRFFRFETHKNTSFTQKRNMNTVDLSSSSVASPTDGGDVELHVLGCATSTFTQLLNSENGRCALGSQRIGRNTPPQTGPLAVMSTKHVPEKKCQEQTPWPNSNRRVVLKN